VNKKRALIGFVLALVFLYFFLRNINLGDLWKTIQQANASWLLISLFFAGFNYFFRALRWRLFFLPIKKTKIRNLFETTVIGFSLNTIFPAKIGEVVRPYLLGAKENISKSAAFATIVVERMFDTSSILFILTFYLVFLVQPDQLSEKARSSLGELKAAGLILFAGILVLLLFLYYLKTKPDPVKKLIRKAERFLPAKFAHSLDDILDSFIQGLSILHDPKLLGQIAVYSIVFWLIICAGFWAGVRAYVPGFAFISTFLVMTLLAIGIAVPTPGGIGSYHLACKLGLTVFFNVPEAKASAVALVTHAIAFIPMTLLGILFLWKEGLSAGKIEKLTESEAGQRPADTNADADVSAH
jgi:uncharacterized protein (TIRG00374 family)